MVKKKTAPKTRRPRPADEDWNLSPNVVLRMPEALRAELEKYCRQQDATPSDVVRQAVAQFLGKPKLAKIGGRGRRWPQAKS